jgi:predicted dehydrogenase
VTYFARVSREGPLRVALVGAGNMGRNWLRLLHESPSVELVGIVDLDDATAREAAASIGRSELALARSITGLRAETALDAVVNVTVPGAHHAVNTEALRQGLPVLCEKPIVPTVAQALDLAATAQVAGQLLMTSQSRRYYRTLDRFREVVGTLGALGIVSCEFHRGPRFGGFRDEMEHPLLLDMAIHAFDCGRFLVGAGPVSVYSDEFNPAWSWYRGDAATVTVFEMEGGTRFVYTGSWCDEGRSTSWNGEWTARGERGSATWDGESAPTADITAPVPDVSPTSTGTPESAEEIAGSLAEFVDSLRTGRTPYGDIHSNVWSLAMVEGAVASAETGARSDLTDLMRRAYDEARESASIPEVRARLTEWGGPEAGLDTPDSN